MLTPRYIGKAASRAMRVCRAARWIAVVGVLLVAACARPYSDPQIEPTYIPSGMNSTIVGLADQAADGPLKIIWTHGVCPTGVNWAVDRTLLVQAALGPGTTVNGSTEPLATLQPVKTIVPQGLTTEAVQVYRSVLETPAHPVDG